MATPRFLTQTPLTDAEPLGDVHARFADVQRAAGAQAALFAEPVPTRDTAGQVASIAWYGPEGGEPTPIGNLTGPARAAADARLRAALAELLPRAKSGPDSALLTAALNLPDANAILALDDKVVFAGWGLIARGDARPPAARVQAILGPWLAAAAPPPTPPRPTPVPRPVGAAVVPPNGAPPNGPPPLPPGGAAPGGPRRWWLLPTGVGIAAIFLALGFVLGWRMLADAVASRQLTADLVDDAATRQAIELQRRTNETLAEEVRRAREALQQNVCLPQPSATPFPPGPGRQPINPQDLPPTPPAPAIPGTPPPVPPTLPGQPPAPDAPPVTPSAPPPRPTNLLQLLDQATVLVVGPGAQGASIGTGWFVAPGLIITNHHVVAAIQGNPAVLSRSLGRVFRAEVIARTPASQPGQADFALLRIEGAPPIVPLPVTRVVQRLDDVVAAGFPAAIVQNDARFAALMQGDFSQVPEMVTTDGRISAVQTLASGLIVMPHTAPISPGNSGGPLTDRCGRIVGVNTFNFVNAQMAERVSYAQKTEALLAFLEQHGIRATEATGACTPQAPIADAPPAAPATPPAAPTPPATPAPATPPATPAPDAPAPAAPQ